MKKLIMAAITATVVIIVLAGCLMPVMEDATATSDTFTNEGLWRMSEIESGDVWTFSSTGPAITYNGVTQDGVTSSGGTNWILGEDWFIRTNGNARGASIRGSASSVTATASEVTIDLDGVTGGTGQSLPGYGIDQTGDYVLLDYTDGAYLNADSVIFGTGQSTIDSVQFNVHVSGNIDDGVTFTAFSQLNGTAISDVVISNETLNYTTDSEHIDLYKFVSATCDITFNTVSDDVTTAHTGTLTYSSVVVPYEVTAERSVHFTDSENAILGIVPVMLIIALLVAIVALVIRNREM